MSYDPLSEVPVSAIIRSSTRNGDPITTGQYAPIGSIGYRGDIRLPEGWVLDKPIGRPRTELWPSNGPWVEPLAPGTEIFGKRRSTGGSQVGQIDWQYAERPKMRPCTPSG